MARIRPFVPSQDRTPKYTVKKVAELMNLSPHTIRYYENTGLIPGVDRTDGNIRMFSEYAVSWLRLIHCLRATGLPIEQVRRYIRMCEKGDSTIPERFGTELQSHISQMHDKLPCLVGGLTDIIHALCPVCLDKAENNGKNNTKS